MLRMYSKDKKWIVVDGEREIVFETSRDAWEYVFFMRGIRPNAPKAPECLNPVKSLNPFPCMGKKKVIIALG